ncbi:olfactory receptor 52B6-like [Xenopus laevis]|uniref:Olfactory receptor 52B6-like n=1 Tax=Xenopus laevis TaxID=8355 RepID=A0A8J1M899_XENLA|nr:olfactory receptor 52B6-like [Xenopus laevis]
MENGSSVSRNFVLLGIVEMEELRYLYCILSLIIYICIMVLSLEIVLVVLTEESLHEPMYIFICNLTFNGMLGSSSFFPKLIIDLLTSSHQISHTGCFLQLLAIITYAIFEISSFTIMAYDRYLAVCDPLRYATKMTNTKAVKLILGFFAFSFFSVLVTVILSARLTYCGTQIKNIFCENLSLIVLSCGDSSVNSLYGILSTVTFLVFTLSIIAYSYLNIFMVCLKISKEACEKAIHTVVTHLLGFSIFLVGGLFIFVRFRLGNNNLPLFAQIILSVTFIVFPPLLNPLIYGIRTKALRVKIFHRLHKFNILSAH